MNEYVLRKVEGKPGEKAITENNERENVKKEVVKKKMSLNPALKLCKQAQASL